MHLLVATIQWTGTPSTVILLADFTNYAPLRLLKKRKWGCVAWRSTKGEEPTCVIGMWKGALLHPAAASGAGALCQRRAGLPEGVLGAAGALEKVAARAAQLTDVTRAALPALRNEWMKSDQRIEERQSGPSGIQLRLSPWSQPDRVCAHKWG